MQLNIKAKNENECNKKKKIIIAAIQAIVL